MKLPVEKTARCQLINRYSTANLLWAVYSGKLFQAGRKPETVPGSKIRHDIAPNRAPHPRSVEIPSFGVC
jgi:hypothetical protein